jgi:hypothetical protein
MFGMSQQQQVALIQQMAQLQLMNGMQKASPSNIGGGIQPLTFPQMPGYVVIPQNQLAQLQQLQEQALRQQLQQQQDQIKKYENETKQLLNKQQNQTTNQNNKNQKISKSTNQIAGGHNGGQQRSLPKRVLVTRVPNHLKTVETLADVFYPYGIISEIQIFKEKSQIPANLVDIIEKVDPRQSNMPAATVEFETSQAAKFAVSIMRKREKQLLFRVALLKGDGVDEKHCHNYVKPTKKVKGQSDASSVLSSDAEHISSGYESSCSKSSGARKHQNLHRASPPSESSLPESEDYDTYSDSNSDSNSKTNKHGPIAPPMGQKRNQTNGKKIQIKKTLKQPVSQFAKYRNNQQKQ